MVEIEKEPKKEIDWGEKLDKKLPVVEEHINPAYTYEQVLDDISAFKERKKNQKNTMNCLVLGQDGTGKTGIVMDYCEKIDKKTMFIDLDGGDFPVFNSYHKNSDKIEVLSAYVADDNGDPSYDIMLSKIKAIAMFVNKNEQDYGCIVLDGISRFLKICEYVMRVEKNLEVDGGVTQRYWISRARKFSETIDLLKSIPMDKFYIAHEDFMVTTDMAMVKANMNQAMHQRIICTKSIGLGKVEFNAKIDKSKFDLTKEGKIIKFATVTKGDAVWDTSDIFVGLK